MRTTTRTVLAGCAAALLATACGSGDDPTVAPPPEVVDTPDDGAAEDDDAGDATDGTDAEVIEVPDGGGADDGRPDPDDLLDGGAPEAGAVDGLDGATEAAVADLAATTGVDPADVEVVTAEPVTWADGSLGCPDDGGMYTQALVPGYRIVLAADGAEVAYHGAEDRAPARCDDPQPPAEGAS